MSGTRGGYARCSTDAQDLTAQREALLALGVDPDRPRRASARLETRAWSSHP